MNSRMWMQWLSLAALYLGWRFIDRIATLVTGREPHFPSVPLPARRVIPRPARYRAQPVPILQVRPGGERSLSCSVRDTVKGRHRNIEALGLNSNAPDVALSG